MAQGSAVSIFGGTWKFRTGILLAFLIAGIAPASAQALELRYPGSMWSEFRFPNAPVSEERDNYVFEGAIEQGIDWRTWRNRYTLNTFADFRFIVDREHLDYNNRLTPGVGVKLKVPVPSGLVQLGLKGVYERRFETDRDDAVVYGFVNCWFGWDLKGK